MEMGSPKDLTPSQVAHLNDLTRDLPETDRLMRSGRDGTIDVTLPMNGNDIVLVELVRSKHGR
jgi:xylan 1,4-beta-xylosidase